MTRRRICETCSCGAQIEYEGDYGPELVQVIRDWRGDHRHELIGVQTIYSGGEEQ